MTVSVILAVVVALLLIGVAVAYAHFPTRKKIMIALDPSWRHRAAVPDFTPEAEAAEERDMFISSTVTRDGCDIIWDEYEPEPPQAFFEPFPDGTVLFVNNKHFNRFTAEFIDRIAGRYVLVTGRENVSTSTFDAEAVVNRPNVIVWFLENFELDRKYLDSGRIVALPLGLNFHKLDPNSNNRSNDMGLPARPGNQQLAMKAIREEIASIRARPLKVYSNFHLNMDTFLRHHHAQKRSRARAEALEALKGKDFVIWEPRQAPRNVVWRRHQEAAFEASPHGNGLDCHRTWEALILRTIPIVKESSLDSMYEGLPVAIVRDWAEVTPERLAAWRDEFAPWFDRPLPPRLFSNYWIRLFHSYKAGAETTPA